jgi:hypothetical protein
MALVMQEGGEIIHCNRHAAIQGRMVHGIVDKRGSFENLGGSFGKGKDLLCNSLKAQR